MRRARFSLMALVLALIGVARAQDTYVLLSEDFENVPLGTSLEESAGTPDAWSDTPPTGWIVDESGVPGVGDPATDGMTEWAGWAFADKEWWTQVAGDQRRSEFTLGQGTIAVADPDEWDDASHPGPNSQDPYDTWLSTPPIDLSSTRPGTVQLKFDSSWRPEYDDDYHQTGHVLVSFDGADPIQLLLWESDSASPNFKNDSSTNETIVVDVPNPAGATSMVITFGLTEAGNDWWWAIDNIVVTGRQLASRAYNPSPENGADEVPAKTVLSWTPGAYVGTRSPKHRVILSDDLDAVENGTAVVSLQDPNSYDATGQLEYSTTYYWRIDEANSVTGWDEGAVWSFAVEAMTYPVEGIIATTNTTWAEGQGPQNVVDGSGLNADDQHGTSTSTMWVGGAGPGETPYIQFEFDRVYKLYEMLVWNYNMDFEAVLGFGIKDTTIEYSENGSDWTALGDIVLNQAPGKVTYTPNTTVAFDGAAAKHVRLTIHSSWISATNHGLSEVRFSYIPAHPQSPDPADGATGVAVDTTLTWRAGRQAVSHQVYLGTDPNALEMVGTTTQNRYAATALDLDTMYTWQVVEVNEAEAVSTWIGDLWSFSTEEYRVIDDFEAYDDDIEAGTTVWQTWIDGLDDGANGGSMVGNDPSPFAEQTIVHADRQSMPLYYDNSSASAISETDRAFAPGQNWTASAIKSLTFWFHGAEGNTGQLYAKINGAKVLYDGPTVNIARPSWQLWSIDLSTVGNVANVTELSIGIEGTGSGVLYIDDVRLYPEVLDYLSPDITGAGDTVQGVPNDGDWPAAEYPDLAIDDDATTKFLHHKGGSTATGLQIAPMVGSTIVTGLTFTAANDAPTRDPITFELSGSNTGIDGPYTPIASGEIVDFAGETAWPRYTKTETPIGFGNATAYTYYQIVFPTLRGATETMMQIAEVELIGTIQ